MRICFDARSSRTWDAGTGRLTVSLLQELRQLNAAHEYLVLMHPDARPIPLSGEGFLLERSPRLNGIIGQHALFGFWARRRGVDVVFHPHQHSLPMWSGIPCAALVLDLLPLVFRRQFPTARVLYYDTLVRAAAGRQNALFAISEASKADVVKYLGISAERVAVLPLAAAQTLRRQDHGCATAATRRFMLRRPFVLYVGNARPHKNVAGLVAAFAQAGLARDCDLVVVGRDDPSEPERDYRPVHRQIEQLGLGDAVRFIGDVTDAELAALYTLAAVVPVVSFYEGFGLPALEAMACGAPVVASRAGALPEVTGNAALLVDPYDVGEIAAMLRSAVSDGAVAERLRDAGLRRAREFSWRRTATQLLSTLESLAS